MILRALGAAVVRSIVVVVFSIYFQSIFSLSNPHFLADYFVGARAWSLYPTVLN